MNEEESAQGIGVENASCNGEVYRDKKEQGRRKTSGTKLEVKGHDVMDSINRKSIENVKTMLPVNVELVEGLEGCSGKEGVRVLKIGEQSLGRRVCETQETGQL